MKLFVLAYDPREGRIVTLEEFSDDERERAHQRRLELELDSVSRAPHVEVVLIWARSLEDLKFSHGSYFGNVGELAARLMEEAS